MKKEKELHEKCEFTPQWACMIKPRLTNTCFGHGCFTFKKCSKWHVSKLEHIESYWMDMGPMSTWR